MIVSSRFPWVSRQSPHRTNPAFPRTRRQPPILVPFWFEFEEGLGNRWLRPSAPMANLVKLHAQCLTNQGANSDFTLTFTPVFPSDRAHGSRQSFQVTVCIFHYSIALMTPLWTVLNDRPSRSSPFLKQLGDSLHALLLIAFDLTRSPDI